MELKVFLVLTAFAILSHAAVLHNGVVLPHYAKVCKRSQPDLDKCLKNSLQTVIQKISKDGLPQINVAPMDPWSVKEFNIKNAGEPFKLGMAFTDSLCYGFSKIQILNVRSNFNNPKDITLDIDILNKKVDFTGNFLAQGLISEFPLLAKGSYSGNLTDVSGPIKIKAHIVKIYGEEYLQIDRVIMTPTIGGLKVQMSNDNNKYPELNNLLVAIMNQFWRPIFQEGLPYFQRNTDKFLTTHINQFTLQIPYNQLIPK